MERKGVVGGRGGGYGGGGGEGEFPGGEPIKETLSLPADWIVTQSMQKGREPAGPR